MPKATLEGLRVCLTTSLNTSPRRASIALEERLQLVRPARVTQLAQRLRLDLANALARHVELLADFLERMVRAHLDAEAHPQHLRLTRRQRVEHVLHHVAHTC